MSRKHRLNEIVSLVASRGTVANHELAERLGVSTATIRRDVALLETQLLIQRRHGSAAPHEAFNDLPLGLKTAKDLIEKRRIAQQALDYVEDVRVIGLTGGTSAFAFARLLADREGLTVVTNALNVAAELVAHRGLRVFVAGGEVRSSSQETIGSAAESFLASYNLDVAFVGVDGVSATAGCTNYDPSGAAVNAMLQQQGKLCVVLADASKIGRVALAQVCAISDVDVLITDSRASEDELDLIRAIGCQVVVV